jgi:hypothetical protein
MPHLVAQALAAACWHQHKQVLVLGRLHHDVPLRWPEAAVAKDLEIDLRVVRADNTAFACRRLLWLALHRGCSIIDDDRMSGACRTATPSSCLQVVGAACLAPKFEGHDKGYTTLRTNSAANRTKVRSFPATYNIGQHG